MNSETPSIGFSGGRCFSREVLLRGIKRSCSEATPEEDASAPKSAAAQDAAVLIPVIDRREGQTLLLTRRTRHLPRHPGQIAFPGGRMEKDDADATACALREAEEEIGLSAGNVDVVGCLSRIMTGTRFWVTPVVAVVTPPFSIRPDPSEVDAVFEAPLAFLFDPANHRRETCFVGENRRVFHVIPYGGHRIWGATAAMVLELCRVLRAGE